MVRHPFPLPSSTARSPRHSASDQPAPDQQDAKLVAIPAPVAPSEPVRQSDPFVIDPLALQQMASILLSAQEIQDASEEGLSVDEKRLQVRHER